MKKYLVTFADGRTREVTAERWEHTVGGAVIFYDDQGNEVVAFVGGVSMIEPRP